MTTTNQPHQTGIAFIGVKAAAAILDVKPNTIYRWIHTDKLPASRVGHKWLIAQATILAMTSTK